MRLKDNTIYNHADNALYIKTQGNQIVIICNNEKQMDFVHERFYNTGNQLVDIELWDEGDNQKWIVTYEITGNKKPILN
jgi:chitinase